MQVINKEIREKGLCRKTVESGNGDIKVKIGEKIIYSVKSILTSSNETMKKLLEDDKFDGLLDLYEECGEIGYYEMEKYYSGGDLELNKENVCEILMFCVCYQDDEMKNNCLNYIQNAINDDILIKLIHINNHFPNSLREIEKLQMMEFEKRGYKYLYNFEYLLMLNINNLTSLLSFKNIIIRSETWLLNMLLEWFKIKINNDEENNEFIYEFKYLLKDHFDDNLINNDEMRDDVKELLKNLNIKFNKSKLIKYIDLNKIKDEKIQNLIINNYNDNDMTDFKDEDKEILNNIKEEDELNDIILSLIETNDTVIIEIVLLIMIYKNLKMEKYISNNDKRNILSRLCMEYNENVNNRVLRCLSLFVNDRKTIITIDSLCGKEILLQILKDKNSSLNLESKALLMKYIDSIESNDKEREREKRMKLEKKVELKAITNFSYPLSNYSFTIYEEVLIIPLFDGDNCFFSINPSLPGGLIIDRTSGIIHGKVEKTFKKKQFEIVCVNEKNDKKFVISLEFVSVNFIDSYKSDGMTISCEGNYVTNTRNGYNHCYLNLKMEKGIYHIRFRFHQNRKNYCSILLGLITENTCYDNYIYTRKTSCNLYIYNDKSENITPYCHIGTVVNNNPNFNNCRDGSIYEVIVDMDKREYWICHNVSSPVLLVKDLPSPLYPYVVLGHQGTAIQLLSVTRS